MSVQTSRNGKTVSLPTVSHYDLLLVILPLPLLAGLLAALVGAVSFPVGAGIGGLPSALMLGYALFVAAPTDASNEDALAN